MELTNKYNYPAAVVEAAKQSLHRPEPGYYGVTSIIDPPLIRYLRMTEWDNLTADVDDFLPALLGTAWHAFVNKYNADCMGEIAWAVNRNYMNEHHITVRGQADLYHTGTLEDHKVVSAWSFVFGKIEWEQQLNLYALLARENGYPVNELWINAFIKDWSKWEAQKRQRENYPDHRFYHISIPLWEPDKAEAFLNERMTDHLEHTQRECTPTEKWSLPDKYAVMKHGRKSAMRVLDTMDEANDWIKEQKKDQNKMSIVHRPGVCRRCEDWCSARSVCPYAKKGE